MTSPKLVSLALAVFLTSLPAFADNGNMMSNNMDGMAAQNKPQNKPMNHPKKAKHVMVKPDKMDGQKAMTSQMSGNGMAATGDGMMQAKPASH
jgi:hypothetical protein